MCIYPMDNKWTSPLHEFYQYHRHVWAPAFVIPVNFKCLKVMCAVKFNIA